MAFTAMAILFEMWDDAAGLTPARMAIIPINLIGEQMGNEDWVSINKNNC